MNRERYQVRFLFGLGLCTFFCSVSNVSGLDQAREWKDVQGRVIEAILKDATQEKVILSKEGREYVLPLARLSEGDREYVKKYIQERQPGAISPRGTKDFPFLTDKELKLSPKISVETLEETIFSLTNELRKTLKVAELRNIEEISKIARAHSVDMRVRGFFSHDNPDGESPTDRARKATFSGLAQSPDGKPRHGFSENIGRVGRYTSIEQSTRNETVIGRRIHWQSEVMLARQIIKGFIDSPAHKKNLLDPAKAYIGVGVHVYREHVFVTQNFF
ncbi:CAP domain-containing protein [Verrucomicrobia bacterium]|nr:CAP domain-containing protein [Verrucomicrobiota bacterium]